MTAGSLLVLNVVNIANEDPGATHPDSLSIRPPRETYDKISHPASGVTVDLVRHRS